MTLQEVFASFSHFIADSHEDKRVPHDSIAALSSLSLLQIAKGTRSSFICRSLELGKTKAASSCYVRSGWEEEGEALGGHKGSPEVRKKVME